MSVKLNPGDTVRVVGSRGTAKIRAILTSVHGALLEKQIDGFRCWNLDDTAGEAQGEIMSPDDSKHRYDRSIAPTRALAVFNTGTESMQITKYQPTTPPADVNTFMLAMWLMYCRAPRRAEPDADGFYSLDEIGIDAEKNWTRLTPYSTARREP